LPEVFIGVGSNVQPEAHIRKALTLLRQQVIIKALSTFYRTLPLGGPAAQASFINGVLIAETDLPPLELKNSVLRGIERRLGRRRSVDRYAPRPIDLDIILYSTLVTKEPGMLIPDPQLYDRPFLALPVSELAPDLVLPDSGMAIAAVAAKHTENAMKPLFGYTAKLRKEFAHEH
jgi:2-amino-4-hydroxy-6-hydroxymethyldihydropteridine diphosphokinase